MDGRGTTEVVQRYRFALAPTPTQERRLLAHCGGARFAFNTMLAAVKANLDQRAAEKSYGLGGDELTPSLGWSYYDLRATWNQRRDTLAPWWSENSTACYRSGCANLAAALDGWSKSRRGARAGAAVGFPRFKSKARATPSWSFDDANGVRVAGDRRHALIPRIGSVRVHESMRKLARRVDAGTARITGSTVLFRRGRWFVSFRVRVQRAIRRPAHVKAGAPVVGVDVGVRDLVTVATPDGVEVARIPAPRPLQQALAELARLQRQAARQQGPWDNATQIRQDPSAGWLKTQSRIRKLHHRVANLREDFLHKTTTVLAQRHDVVGAETLDVKAMMRRGPGKRRLNRALGDAALATVLRQLKYKSAWYGATVVEADRYYPSSKTCSGCGAVKAKLPLSVRMYDCEHCGTRLDRDLNAAVNLARRAAITTGRAYNRTTGATTRLPAAAA